MGRSLDNMSEQIRWSLDLRWQRPDAPNGFYGLKDCITMAKSDDPSFKVCSVGPAVRMACFDGEPCLPIAKVGSLPNAFYGLKDCIMKAKSNEVFMSFMVNLISFMGFMILR